MNAPPQTKITPAAVRVSANAQPTVRDDDSYMNVRLYGA
jgi:hypothetical protein